VDVANGSVSPISLARAIAGVTVRATDRLPADTDAETEPIGLTRAARATDSVGTLCNPTRPPRELHRNESARAENRKGEGKAISSAGRIENARADVWMETPKRDRPEAGRPGQRERSQ
jgi:hypothetical protein